MKIPLKSRHPITSDSLHKILNHILRKSPDLKPHGTPDYPKIGYFKEQDGTLLKQLNPSTYKFYLSPNALPNFLFPITVSLEKDSILVKATFPSVPKEEMLLWALRAVNYISTKLYYNYSIFIDRSHLPGFTLRYSNFP